MIVYTFDYESGAYTGTLELGAADVDPHSHSWVIPGNATIEPPPNCGAHLAPRRVNGRWEVWECVADIPDRLMKQWRERVEIILEARS